MAQRRTTSLVDDLNGSVAAETVRFGVDGPLYEIDLSATHARELRAALAPFVRKARKVRAAAAPARRQPLRIAVTIDPEWAGSTTV